MLHHVAQVRLYGLKSIWRGARRVNVSDPAQTLIDMLAMPETGGGIDYVADCLTAHAWAKDYSSDLLIRYAGQFGNGAVFKRLGYLAETRLHNADLAAACRSRLTQGYAQLDPARPSTRLHTAWRLWVPERWTRVAP